MRLLRARILGLRFRRTMCNVNRLAAHRPFSRSNRNRAKPRFWGCISAAVRVISMTYASKSSSIWRGMACW